MDSPNDIPTTLTARLAPGEEVLLHHSPDMENFRFWQRFFLLMVGGMIAIALAGILFTGGSMPLWAKLATCLGALAAFAVFALLFRFEGRRLARHTAIVTPQRILWASGRELRIVPGMHARTAGNYVLIYHKLLPYKLFYPADKAALAADLNRIFQSTTVAKGGADG
jgi:hypothetical protein